MNNIIGFCMFIEFVISFIFLFCVSKRAESMSDEDMGEYYILPALKSVLIDLFSDRNFFGIIISTVIVIITIPGMLFVILGELAFWIIYLIAFIWDLGTRK